MRVISFIAIGLEQWSITCKTCIDVSVDRIPSWHRISNRWQNVSRCLCQFVSLSQTCKGTICKSFPTNVLHVTYTYYYIGLGYCDPKIQNCVDVYRLLKVFISAKPPPPRPPPDTSVYTVSIITYTTTTITSIHITKWVRKWVSAYKTLFAFIPFPTCIKVRGVMCAVPLYDLFFWLELQ